MENKLTEEQQKEIAVRVKAAHDYLQKNELTVACQIAKQNLGDDVFGDKLYPYLQDLKYSAKPSPIQSKDL